MKTPAKTTRNLTLLLATMAMAALLAALPAWADTTFTVNATTDAPDADTADGVCDSDSQATGNQCTLRAAIQEANALSGDDVIGFDPSVGGTITLGGSELLIDSNLTIEGPGEDELSVSGDRKSRVFRVQGGTVEVGGLTITGGKADDHINACLKHNYGGGILNDGGTLTLTDTTVSQNTAHCGAAGIYNVAGTLTVSNSTITGNTGEVSGGGIYSFSGTLAVSDSAISENTAEYGGGIYNRFGSLTVSASTISGNTANGQGGGLYSSTDSDFTTSKTTIANTTISGNSATDDYGGGVFNYGGLTEIGHSTITDNSAPAGKGSGVASYGDAVTSTEIYSSIISANDNPENTGTDVDFVEDSTNSFVSEGYNLVGDGNATAAFNKNGDQRGVADPRLGPLQDNGGPTDTHALLAGSPAIDAVPVGTNGCAADFTADQRGVHRPLGGACDAGSVENFGFGGFYSPVDNPDVLNRAKAGSSIPVKFSLGGDMGLDIFATGTDANNNAFTYPTSSAMRCDSTDPVDAIEETVAAGGGSLSYDPTLDRYTYVWKTQKAWAGTCRQLVVKLDDGTYHRANFKFVR